MMAKAFAEMNRVLKPGGTLAVVYAHKTTLGWSTLVDAFRRAGCVVTEAWPLDTETVGRLRARDSAALASSIFLVGRKREVRTGVGNYEDDVQPELQEIVRERVETLWDMGITGRANASKVTRPTRGLRGWQGNSAFSGLFRGGTQRKRGNGRNCVAKNWAGLNRAAPRAALYAARKPWKRGRRRNLATSPRRGG
jgi:hypothetical protein